MKPAAPDHATQQWLGVIAAERLTKQFKSTVAVSELDLIATPGTMTCLLGRPGSGKTTTLRMLLGLVRPTSGTALVNGVPFVHLKHPARVVGAVLDGQGFPTGRTARKHLRVYAAAIGVPDPRVDAMLELVGLSAVANRGIRSYLPPMRRRLALALALLGEPQMLVLDEPTAGLDPPGVGWLRALLADFTYRGGTVLVTGRALRQVELDADQLVIVRSGQCVFRGAPTDLRAGRQPRLLVAAADIGTLARALVARQIYDVVWRPDGRLAVGGAAAAQIRETAVLAGIPVRGIVAEYDDLERAFLALTAAP